MTVTANFGIVTITMAVAVDVIKALPRAGNVVVILMVIDRMER